MLERVLSQKMLNDYVIMELLTVRNQMRMYMPMNY